jgi:protein gp37
MKDSTIAWTHHTINFWKGCSGRNCEIKALCYAAADAKRYGWGFDRVRPTQANIWSDPFRWNEEAKRQAKSYRVFASSFSDFFDHEADGFRHAAWDVIRRCGNLTWMILTKRPENIIDRLPEDWGQQGYDHVWLGTTVTGAKHVNRIDTLRQVPAHTRFISAEPLIASLGNPDLSGFDLLIVGGMSGDDWKRHEMKLEWAEEALALARRYRVKFFFKQVSAKRDGRRPDALGAIYNELPEGLFPWMPTTADDDAEVAPAMELAGSGAPLESYSRLSRTQVRPGIE